MGELQTKTNSQPLTLIEKISSVTDQLMPASDDSIAAAIIHLAGCGLPFSTGINPENASRVYQFALRGVSREAIKRTVSKIVQGEVQSALQFIPSPPLLAALCKAEARELWNDRDRLVALKDALEFKRPDRQKTDGEKARVAQLVEQVKANAAAIRDVEKNAFYDQPEDDLNRIFRNKISEPATEPPAGKWSDEEWFAQQRKMENGEENIGTEGHGQAVSCGEPDGPDDGRKGNDVPFGFEDGGD